MTEENDPFAAWTLAATTGVFVILVTSNFMPGGAAVAIGVGAALGVFLWRARRHR